MFIQASDDLQANFKLKYTYMEVIKDTHGLETNAKYLREAGRGNRRERYVSVLWACGRESRVQLNSIRSGHTKGFGGKRLGDVEGQLPLRNGGVTLVDTSEWHRLREFNWRLDAKGYVTTTVDGCPRKLHRLLLNYPDFSVDHVNGDKRDNRLNNLRIDYLRQNAQNKKKTITNKSGNTGICWNKRTGKWRAYCGASGEEHYLGNYDCLLEAFIVRERFAESAHGDYFANKLTDATNHQ